MNEQRDADDSVVVDARIGEQQTGNTKAATTKAATTKAATNASQKNPATSSSYYYTPEPETDQIHREIKQRGDDASVGQALQVQQNDQFYHDVPSATSRQTITPQRGGVEVSSRGSSIKNNEQRLIDLFAVKGGVTEVAYQPAGNGPTAQLQSNVNYRARVISVTPAPPSHRESLIEEGERSHIRRIVVSKPIETVQTVSRETEPLITHQRQQQRPVGAYGALKISPVYRGQ